MPTGGFIFLAEQFLTIWVDLKNWHLEKSNFSTNSDRQINIQCFAFENVMLSVIMQFNNKKVLRFF
jgi:hypothetical protein